MVIKYIILYFIYIMYIIISEYLYFQKIKMLTLKKKKIKKINLLKFRHQ